MGRQTIFRNDKLFTSCTLRFSPICRNIASKSESHRFMRKNFPVRGTLLASEAEHGSNG